MRAALLARKAATIGQSVDRAASDETRAAELAAGASSPSSGARLRLHSTLSPSLMGSPSPGGKRAEARARMTAYDEGEFDCAWSDDEHVLYDDSDHRVACDDNDDDDDDDERAPPLPLLRYGDDGEQCLYSDDEAVQGESSAHNSARRDCDDCMTDDGGEDDYETLRPRTVERSVWGWTDAEDEFPGLQFQVLADDDHSLASACEAIGLARAMMMTFLRGNWRMPICSTSRTRSMASGRMKNGTVLRMMDQAPSVHRAVTSCFRTRNRRIG